MSRYLELSVEGTTDNVGERALRAFKRVGKVAEQDLATSQIVGIIKVDGEPADVRISWKPGKEGRTRIEIAANSNDTLNQAADSALYTYASAYKAVGWPNPEQERREQKQRQLRIVGGAISAFLLLVLVAVLMATTRYQTVR